MSRSLVAGRDGRMNAVDALVEFLLARIAEDEEVATRPCGEAHPEADVYCYPPEHPDPKRMVECEAKRRIVEANTDSYMLRRDAPNDLEYGSTPEGFLVRMRTGGAEELMRVDDFQRRYMEPSPPSINLRLLALPYADHPDYREEWKP